MRYWIVCAVLLFARVAAWAGTPDLPPGDGA